MPREKRRKRKHAGDDAEDMLAAALALFAHSARPEEHVLARFERQYRYAPPRMLRADFAWIEARLIVELDGGIWAQSSSHGSSQGILRDIDRLNAATLAGWRSLRFPTDAAEDGQIAETIDVILRALRTPAYIG